MLTMIVKKQMEIVEKKYIYCSNFNFLLKRYDRLVKIKWKKMQTRSFTLPRSYLTNIDHYQFDHCFCELPYLLSGQIRLVIYCPLIILVSGQYFLKLMDHAVYKWSRYRNDSNKQLRSKAAFTDYCGTHFSLESLRWWMSLDVSSPLRSNGV